MSERLLFKGISINKSLIDQSLINQSLINQSLITQSLINQSLITQTKATDRYVIHFQLADKTARRYIVRLIPILSEC